MVRRDGPFPSRRGCALDHVGHTVPFQEELRARADRVVSRWLRCPPKIKTTSWPLERTFRAGTTVTREADSNFCISDSGNQSPAPQSSVVLMENVHDNIFSHNDQRLQKAKADRNSTAEVLTTPLSSYYAPSTTTTKTYDQQINPAMVRQKRKKISSTSASQEMSSSKNYFYTQALPQVLPPARLGSPENFSQTTHHSLERPSTDESLVRPLSSPPWVEVQDDFCTAAEAEALTQLLRQFHPALEMENNEYSLLTGEYKAVVGGDDTTQTVSV